MEADCGLPTCPGSSAAPAGGLWEGARARKLDEKKKLPVQHRKPGL
jgi:hypothetical protein